jgi:hypothetical protein
MSPNNMFAVLFVSFAGLTIINKLQQFFTLLTKISDDVGLGKLYKCMHELNQSSKSLYHHNMLDFVSWKLKL